MSTANHEESDILQVEGVLSKGFGFAPKLVMQDQRLSAVGKAIYCYFCSYAGAGKIAFPRVSKIMADLKINRDTFYAHFKPLKTYGFIKVEQTRVDGKHSHNVYTLMEQVPVCTVNESDENKPFSPCPKIPHTVETYENKPFLPCPKIPDTVQPDTVLPDPVKPDTNNNSIKNNRSKNNIFEKHPPNPPQAEGARAGNEQTDTSDTLNGATGPDKSKESKNQSSENLKLKTGGGEDEQSSSHSTTLIDERFETFWEAYPRKVGKSAVYKAWKRLKPDKELFARILSAVDNAKATEQWRREAGRFIPNPLTWINQGRWDDVYIPAAPARNAAAPNNGNALTRLIGRMEAEESANFNEAWGYEL